MEPSSEKPDAWQGEPIPYDAPTAELRERVRVAGPPAWAAFRALAERDTDEALHALAEAARFDDPFLRRAAVGSIGLHPRGRALAATLTAALHDVDEYVVRTACAAASLLRLAESHDTVRGLLTHRMPTIRESALRTLGSLWTPDDFEPVLHVFRQDSSEEVRDEAAWVLRAHATEEHWRALFDAWSRDPLARRRLWACEVAGSFGDTGVLPELEQLRADKDGHVRKAAVRAMAAVNGRGSSGRARPGSA